MPNEYEVIEFDRGFVLDEDAEVIGTQLSEGGTRSSSNAKNRALVRRPDDGVAQPSEGVDETYSCGVELDSGGTCDREVSAPDENCWQHE
jgi:hypothetical protein